MSTANIYAESTLHNKVFNEQRSNAKHVGLFIQDSLIGRDSNSKTAQTLSLRSVFSRSQSRSFRSGRGNTGAPLMSVS